MPNIIVGGVTLLVWEILLTLDSEIKYVWSYVRICFNNRVVPRTYQACSQKTLPVLNQVAIFVYTLLRAFRAAVSVLLARSSGALTIQWFLQGIRTRRLTVPVPAARVSGLVRDAVCADAGYDVCPGACSPGPRSGT